MDSDSDVEDLYGFTNSDIEGLNNVEEAENDSESDVFVSSVNKDDFSDFCVSEDEEDVPEQAAE